MKTIDELTAMLPPEVSGVAGCEAWNDRRKTAFAAIECAHRMASAKLDRLRPDAIECRAIERDYDKAEIAYAVAVARLARDRRALLGEPDATDATQPAVVWDQSLLRLAGDVPGATAFNSRLTDFGRRQIKALKELDNARGWAILAMADKKTDETRRAYNVANKNYNDAARPFVAERKRLIAERSVLTKKAKVTK